MMMMVFPTGWWGRICESNVCWTRTIIEPEIYNSEYELTRFPFTSFEHVRKLWDLSAAPSDRLMLWGVLESIKLYVWLTYESKLSIIQKYINSYAIVPSPSHRQMRRFSACRSLEMTHYFRNGRNRLFHSKTMRTPTHTNRFILKKININIFKRFPKIMFLHY